MICPSLTPPEYFIIAEGVPPLLYYSHIPTIIISLLIGTFVFTRNIRSLPNILLFVIAVGFSLWTLLDLIVWTNVDSDVITFTWSFFGLLHSIICIGAIYFMYAYLTKQDVGWGHKAAFVALLLPVIALTPTSQNVSGFNLDLCGSSGYEGLTFVTYYTALGFLAMTWIFLLSVIQYFRSDREFRKQVVLMGVGIELFLFSFSSTGFLASYLNEKGILVDYSLEHYGLFGMTAFMAIIAFMIVRFKTFNTGVIAAQALIISLIILISSQFAFVSSTINQVLVAVTLIITGAIGITLIRSVKNEIEQRKRIEALATDLEAANDRLKELDQMKSEFLSIASHQLRAPITAVRGYAANINEGAYGPIPEHLKEPLETVQESARLMAGSIEDYLNISRIEQNRMKYEKSDFDLTDLAKKVVTELTPVATKRKLMLSAEVTEPVMVNADIGKIKQVISNLVDNAIKYTEQGSVSVAVKRDSGKARVAISDTGIGIPVDEIDGLFEKFKRARGANKVNTTGTGLGLYVAKQLVEGHGGSVRAESDGPGKGSRFIIELPI